MEMYREDSFELKTRMQNLMWTVSGDYDLDTEMDLSAFHRSKYIGLYDAALRGGFAKFFDQEFYGGYLVRKVFLGADSNVLMRLSWLCSDSASWKKMKKERPGIPDIRKRAMEDTLERDFGRLSGTPWGRLEAGYLRHELGDTRLSRQTASNVEMICELADAENTLEVVRALDALYNAVFDQEYGKMFSNISLDQVLAVSNGQLKEYDWKDYLNEEASADSVERLVNRFHGQMFETEEEKEKKIRKGHSITYLDAESVSRMDQYIELNYGKTYLGEREKERLNWKICRDAHSDSSLHFTDGILSGMVRVNAQSEYARRTREVNLRVFKQHDKMSRQNIRTLSLMLKRALTARTERESFLSDHGRIQADRLWNLGRTSNRKLFIWETMAEHSEFAVEVLMDASGSQRTRQSEVALQGYMISRALSEAKIPHRVMGFCSFWDYTVMRRFRDYEEGPEADERIFEFYGSANNRDGLAIRAAAESLENRPEENKILIVLSDGRPNDIVVNRPHSRNPKPYYGEYGVKDTALEVRKLRNRGTAVLGVFTGKEEDLQAEKKIYGKDFAYIHDLADFSRVVGRYLKKQLLEET